MKTKILFPIVALVALSVLLGGCATGLAASSWPGVTADSQYAYVAGGPYVYALNLETGVQEWRFPEKPSTAAPFHATPVLTADERLIVGGFDHKLYSLDPQDGSVFWTFAGAHDRYIGSALVTDDMIYAPNADYNLYALDMNGELKWTFEADQSIWGAPVTDGQNVYFGTLGHQVYAVNMGTHEIVWQVDVEGAILGSPVLQDGVLYLGVFDGALVALNTRNGNELWRQSAGSWVWSGPALVGDLLYFGDGDGNLYALTTDGNLQWSQKLNGAIVGTPLISGSKIIVGTNVVDTKDQKVYILDLTGENIETVSISGTAYGMPVAAGKQILLGLTENVDKAILMALDENGTTQWSFIPAK